MRKGMEEKKKGRMNDDDKRTGRRQKMGRGIEKGG